MVFGNYNITTYLPHRVEQFNTPIMAQISRSTRAGAYVGYAKFVLELARLCSTIGRRYAKLCFKSVFGTIHEKVA